MSKRARTVTLLELAAGVKKRCPKTTVPIVDLYAGVGGFSTGARAAGHRIAIAVDGWDTAVHWHAQNHPETDHYLFWLPNARMDALLPAPDTQWHLHGSPPCQLLSKAHGQDVRSDKWDEGLENVRFYLELARTRRPASFSMEQVANPVVIRLMDEYKERYPNWVEYEVVDMSEYGVPQARKRLIAGSVWLIRSLRDKKRTMAPRAIRDACTDTMPENAIGAVSAGGNKGPTQRNTGPAFQKYEKRRGYIERCKKEGICAPSPTVLASNLLTWVGPGGTFLRCLSFREHANVQTFPATYKFPDNCKTAQKLCGNSVPPDFAHVLMSDYRLPEHLHDLPLAVFPARPRSPSLDLAPQQ